MQYPTPEPTGGSGRPQITLRDAAAMIELASIAGAMRNDARGWRSELLSGLCSLLGASVAAAFVLRQLDSNLAVATLLDSGFKSERQKRAFHEEFSASPFRDPHSRQALVHFLAQRPETYTCLRGDLVPDDVWNADAHVLMHRRGSGLGDCVLSIRGGAGADRNEAYVLAAYRHVVTEPAPGSPEPGADIVAASRFTVRERTLLDAIHKGIGSVYRAEEAQRRTQPSTPLTPRMRETLEHLLVGLTERQVALKMSLSIHTVHDYVKQLYSHFGVSRRSELLSKWIQSTGKPPMAE